MSSGELWKLANRLYASPGVSDACLRLQDECAVDVCVLMLLLFLARRKRAVRATQVQMILRASNEWRAEIVQVLRVMRRRLKVAPRFVEADSRESLRSLIKKAELQAEHLQLDALEATFAESRICDQARTIRGAAGTSIESYESALSCVFPADAAELLITATEEDASDG